MLSTNNSKTHQQRNNYQTHQAGLSRHCGPSNCIFGQIGQREQVSARQQQIQYYRVGFTDLKLGRLIRNLTACSAKTRNTIFTNQVTKNHIELYSPLIYDHISRIAKSKRVSLHTLCNAMMIFQKYCQKMKLVLNKNKNGQRSIDYHIDTSRQIEQQLYKPSQDHYQQYYTQIKKQESLTMQQLEFLAHVCLEISADLHETNSKNQSHKNVQRMSKSKQNQLKLKIIKTLSWQINHITFIQISQILFFWLKNQFLDKFKILSKSDHCPFSTKKSDEDANFKYFLENQQYIMVEQFNFLKVDVLQCVALLFSRFIANYEVEIFNQKEINASQAQAKQALSNFLLGSAQLIGFKVSRISKIQTSCHQSHQLKGLNGQSGKKMIKRLFEQKRVKNQGYQIKLQQVGMQNPNQKQKRENFLLSHVKSIRMFNQDAKLIKSTSLAFSLSSTLNKVNNISISNDNRNIECNQNSISVSDQFLNNFKVLKNKIGNQFTGIHLNSLDNTDHNFPKNKTKFSLIRQKVTQRGKHIKKGTEVLSNSQIRNSHTNTAFRPQYQLTKDQLSIPNHQKQVYKSESEKQNDSCSGTSTRNNSFQ